MSKSILPLSGCLYISKDLCLQIKFLQNPETPYLTDRLENLLLIELLPLKEGLRTKLHNSLYTNVMWVL